MKAPIKRYSDENNTLEVVSLHHIVVKPGSDPWRFPLHNHSNHLEISLVVSGKASFEIDHARYTLNSGDLVVKNAGTLHSETSSVEEGFEQYCIGISGIMNPGMDPDTLVPDSISPVIQTGSAFDYLRAMTAYLYNLSSDDALKASGLAKQAIENEISLINMLISNAVEVSDHTPHSELVEDVLNYIDTHVGETLSLETLARQFYVSTYHLSHKFKQEFGCTVNQYILNRKLGEAQQRLVFSDDPIKKIAADCGYSNLQYFYTVFKKYTGSTPAETRHYYQNVRRQVK